MNVLCSSLVGIIPYQCHHDNPAHLHNVLRQGVDPGPEPPGHRDPILGVGDLVLVLLRLEDQVVVYGAGLDGVDEVNEWQTRGDGLVLEP